MDPLAVFPSLVSLVTLVVLIYKLPAERRSISADAKKTEVDAELAELTVHDKLFQMATSREEAVVKLTGDLASLNLAFEQYKTKATADLEAMSEKLQKEITSHLDTRNERDQLKNQLTNVRKRVRELENQVRELRIRLGESPDTITEEELPNDA